MIWQVIVVEFLNDYKFDPKSILIFFNYQTNHLSEIPHLKVQTIRII